MASPKNKLKLLDELRSLDDKQLAVRVQAAREQLAEHYRSLAAQELPSAAVIRKTRKEIAASLTLLSEKQRSAQKEEEK
jgi:ribosomal protein L29